MLTLDKSNWKCANCANFSGVKNVCAIDNDEFIYPNMRYEVTDECNYFIDSEHTFSVNYTDDNLIEVKYKTEARTYTASVQLNPDWDENMISVAIFKMKQRLIDEIAKTDNVVPSIDAAVINETSEDIVENFDDDNDDENNETPIDNASVSELISRLNTLLENNQPEHQINPEQEAMLDGDTEISWFERVTSWRRVLNAARRTIGREQLDKEPSDSWKAKILLAEHSPIRLLEYDFGWKKIRQWVTAHFVRHHQGCEKFVHSQRGDRRELPCDRDHIYQGAKNDMDMTVNAQSFINISRKRCCMCASKETRDAWAMVLNELEKVDPVLRSKCVRECVYRGFCPEWMSKCKYCYSPAYWLEVKNYRNTTFGNDENWKTNEDMKLMVSSIGRISDLKGNIYEEKADARGAYITIDNERYYVRDIMDATYGTAGLDYVDGNKYNNALSNLV